MKYSVIALFLITLASCRSDAEAVAKYLADSIRAADSVRAAVVNAKIDRYAEIRDSLSENCFEFITDGYGHNTWGGVYSMKTDGLSMKIDVDGNITYVSCLGPKSKREMRHTSVRIATPTDTAWLADSHTAFTRVDETMPGVEYEYVEFGSWDEITVAEFIVAHRYERIMVSPMMEEEIITTYELTDADKKAVADCILMSTVISELNDPY